MSFKIASDQANEKKPFVWLVPPTEYKLIRTKIKRINGDRYLFDNYKYYLTKNFFFNSKNEAIDCLIKRLQILKDRHYTQEELQNKDLIISC
jgi:hypothetical protein